MNHAQIPGVGGSGGAGEEVLGELDRAPVPTAPPTWQKGKRVFEKGLVQTKECDFGALLGLCNVYIFIIIINSS